MRWLSIFSLLFFFLSCKKDYSDLNTKVLGHAGETLDPKKSEFLPNKKANVQLADSKGAEGIEVDVQMTSDGGLVAFHDYLLDDNSTGSGCIPSHTTAEVLTYNIYESSDHIDPLYKILDEAVAYNMDVMLDIKHYNECLDQHIDYTQFNNSLNNILANYTAAQKEKIIVNCRDKKLFDYITDTLVVKSLESDDIDFALPIIKAKELDMLTIKLKAIDDVIKDSLNANNLQLSIYNVKTSKNTRDALKYAPEFVISDNIECTVKTLNGK